MSGSPNGTDGGARPVLLAVDDEPANLRLLHDIFGADCRMLAATDGEQALKLCRASQPDLVLLDVVMPGMDGFEVIARLKADAATAATPVIFVTGNGGAEQEMRALAAGGADFITKPYNASVVRARVGLQITLLQQRRELQQRIAELRVSQAAAEEANRATKQFLSSVSHELRTPLTSIRGFAELMEQRIESPVFRRQAGLIRKAAEHLHQLLSEILDLSKLEAGAMPVVREPVALRQLIQDSAEFFEVTARAKGIALVTEVAATVPERGAVDGLRVKQILNNLLSNAFKFTERGEIRIALGGDARRLTLAVSDTGPGIAPALHDRIFQRFRQADDRVAHQHGGTGLGLALSRGLAERMGGTLHVESSPGEGARFVLALPMEVDDAIA